MLGPQLKTSNHDMMYPYGFDTPQPAGRLGSPLADDFRFLTT